jgi:cell division protein ZapA (FtsZ GTPase activity inhibitor)
MKTKVTALTLMAVFIFGLLVFVCVSEEQKKITQPNKVAQRAKHHLVNVCEKYLAKNPKKYLGCDRYLLANNHK